MDSIFLKDCECQLRLWCPAKYLPKLKEKEKTLFDRMNIKEFMSTKQSCRDYWKQYIILKTGINILRRLQKDEL